MNDESFEAIDAAMKSLRGLRRDKQADRKRRAREAIAATVDAWIATLDDQARARFINGICAAASAKNAKLIEIEYPIGKA